MGSRSRNERRAVKVEDAPSSSESVGSSESESEFEIEPEIDLPRRMRNINMMDRERVALEGKEELLRRKEYALKEKRIALEHVLVVELSKHQRDYEKIIKQK